MNIGIVIGRIGDVDGVALETEKWIHVLQNMGHKVFIMSGRFRNHIVPPEQEKLFQCLSFFSPNCEWEQNRAFFFPEEDPGELLEHLEYASRRVASNIFEWVEANRIDQIIVENASALPCHLSMGIGIKKALRVMDIPTITHDHDFYWERGGRYHTPHKELQKIIESTFPLDLPNVQHAVINKYSKDMLKNRLGVDSTVVPNVMDFSKSYGKIDSYNRDLNYSLGFEKNDIPLYQITRIVKRKGIETAINLVHKLKDPDVKLVITGSTADDERKGYYKKLLDHIKVLDVKDHIIFAYKKVLSERGTSYQGQKIYSLEDAYANAAACTYFSTYEGFGNAFVESVLAKRPVFVNNYKPVYWPDIGSLGFKTVMLEDNNLTDDAVEEIREILHNKRLQEEIVEHNFELGKKHFSYSVLQKKLEIMLKKK